MWNRREGFVNANNLSSTQAVRNQGKIFIDANKPRILFSGALLESEQTPFGSWGFGDKVTVFYNGLAFNVVVRTLTVSGSASGLTQVGSGGGGALTTKLINPLIAHMLNIEERLVDLELVEVA